MTTIGRDLSKHTAEMTKYKPCFPISGQVAYFFENMGKIDKIKPIQDDFVV